MIAVWGPREAHALREAMRLSIDDFAQQLDVSRRGVAAWSGKTSGRLRWDVQRKLDAALAAAPAEVGRRLASLLGEGPPPGDPGPPAAAGPTASALASLSSLLVLPPQADIGPPPALIRLERDVAGLRMAYQAARYTEVLARLPVLARSLAQARADAEARFPWRVRRLTSAVHQTTAGLLLKLGDLPLAMLAAERGVSEAEASGDPLIVAASACCAAQVLQRSGHGDSALARALGAARDLVTATGLRGPRPLSAHGALLLSAATAAARTGDAAAATRLLTQADDAAKTLGADGNFGWTAFGPTNVQLHRLGILLELSDPATALQVCAAIDPGVILQRERLASYHVDSARAFRAISQPGAAVSALKRAYAAAPEEVRLRPETRSLAAELARAARGPAKARAARFAELVLHP